VDKFPFRIRTIRTDRGHEFQALFHWHVADLGMEHVYIKPRTPQLNGKVERSHRTDVEEEEEEVVRDQLKKVVATDYRRYLEYGMARFLLGMHTPQPDPNNQGDEASIP